MRNDIFFFDNQYKITTGFFSENTIVVAEGEMLLEGIFQVSLAFFNTAICLFTFATLKKFGPYWSCLRM